jgi:hypothetical protein
MVRRGGIIDLSKATFTDRLNDQPIAVPMDDRFVAGRTAWLRSVPK